MRSVIYRFFILYISIWMLPTSGLAATIKAGVAKVDITPPLGLKMYGYGSRTQGAIGVMDPLYARVLVFRDVLIHDYLGVDISLVWRITQTYLPELKRQIDAMLST